MENESEKLEFEFSARGIAALLRLVKSDFRGWLWGSTAM